MTNDRLSLSYLKKAKVRLEALSFYQQKQDYSDVVREAQECVLLGNIGLFRREIRATP